VQSSFGKQACNIGVLKLSQNLLKMVYSCNTDENVEERLCLAVTWQIESHAKMSPVLRWTKRALWSWILPALNCLFIESSRPYYALGMIFDISHALALGYKEHELTRLECYFRLDRVPVELDLVFPSGRWVDRNLVEATLNLTYSLFPSQFRDSLDFKDWLALLSDPRQLEETIKYCDLLLPFKGYLRPLVNLLLMLL
jgi:hypothetical protein